MIVRTLYLRLLIPFFRILSMLRKEVWWVEADAKHDRKREKILFVGDNKEMYYIGDLFFCNKYRYTSKGHHWLWQILRKKSNINKQCQFVIIQSRWTFGRLLKNQNTFCIPSWVYGSVKLEDDFANFIKRSKSARSNIKKVIDSQFDIEIVKSRSDFEMFYHKMLYPYSQKRYGKFAVIDNYGQLGDRYIKNGELIFIKKGSQCIAGMLLLYEEGEVTSYRIGILNGDIRWVKEGAISALYYHAIRYCSDNGHQKINLGGSRPFLSDGVMRYKLTAWNMKIDGYAKAFYFILKPLKKSHFVKEFLKTNPFISLKGNHIVANVFIDDISDEKVVVKAKKKYLNYGISKIDIHSC